MPDSMPLQINKRRLLLLQTTPMRMDFEGGDDDDGRDGWEEEERESWKGGEGGSSGVDKASAIDH